MSTLQTTYAMFMRHGEYAQPPGVPSAWLPHPLTVEGRLQAAAAAAKIRELASAHELELCPRVHSSTLLRAVETAHGVMSSLGIEPEHLETTPALKERGLGSLANLTVSEIEAIARQDPRVGPLPQGWKAMSHFRLPYDGAESLFEAGARVAAYVDAVSREVAAREGGPKVTLFVGHGAAFRHAAVAFGVLQTSRVPALSMYHCDPILLVRETDARWRHVGGDWKVRPCREHGAD
jgi:2,3-bisphosphoglycerate-dependent phosphoglycerate mutase